MKPLGLFEVAPLVVVKVANVSDLEAAATTSTFPARALIIIKGVVVKFLICNVVLDVVGLPLQRI